MDIRKIGILVLGTTVASTLASNLGIVTMWQLLVINIAAIVIMTIMIIFLIYRIRKMTKAGTVPFLLPDVKVIIPKAHIDNKFILANSDVFNKNIVPTNPLRKCVFRISMEINESIERLNIYALRFRDSKIIENTLIKNLVAKEAYVIDTIVLPSETINFKFDKDIDIRKMLIDELYIP
jgi:hypothetical protein